MVKIKTPAMSREVKEGINVMQAGYPALFRVLVPY
jgi:hypothetical protein